jgi:hypothetical protein
LINWSVCKNVTQISALNVMRGPQCVSGGMRAIFSAATMGVLEKGKIPAKAALNKAQHYFHIEGQRSLHERMQFGEDSEIDFIAQALLS